MTRRQSGCADRAARVRVRRAAHRRRGRPWRRGYGEGGSATRAHGEGGSATVWVLCCCLLVWGAGLAALARGSAVVARHRAETAADLGALAAARAALSGATQPCDRAAAVAVGNRARVVACAVGSDLSVSLEVAVAAPAWAGLELPPARARARAGGQWSAIAAPLAEDQRGP